MNNIEADRSDWRERAWKVLQKWKEKRKWSNSGNAYKCFSRDRKERRRPKTA